MNYENLKALVNAKVYENTEQEITGEGLNEVLQSIVASLEKGYQFIGIATPSTNPGTPDQNVFYIASEIGTYSNFGGLAVSNGEIAIFKYNGTWAKDVTGCATTLSVEELHDEIYGGTHSFTKNIAVTAKYARVQLDEPLVAGMVITGYQATPNMSVWLGDTAARLNLSTAVFPLTLERDYSAIFGEYNGAVVLSGNDGSGLPDTDGILPKVTTQGTQIDSILEHISKAVNYTVFESILLKSWNLNGTIRVGDSYSDYSEKVYKLSAGKTYRFVPTSYNNLSTYSNVYLLGYVQQATISDGSTITKIVAGSEKTTDTIVISPDSDCYIAVLSNRYGAYYTVMVDDVFEYKNLSQRGVLNITKEMTDIEIYNRLSNAANVGNYDVFFERGEYVFSNVFLYIRDTLKLSGYRSGLPMGGGCRYFFNGSTLISRHPGSDYNDSRSLLKFEMADVGGDFEIYDVTLISEGGTYCVHDEGGGYTKPYSHLYKNVVAIYKKSTDTETGSKPFGFGTGKSARISVDGCVLVNENNDACFALHGPIGMSDTPFYLHLDIKGSYFSRSSLAINESSFDATRDDLLVVFANNTARNAFSLSKIKLYEYGTSIV